jgi:hypothetical protein
LSDRKANGNAIYTSMKQELNLLTEEIKDQKELVYL